MSIPYTYLLTHIPSGKRYYGVRYAKGCQPSDLWVTYFSSSKVIHKMIERDGADSFQVEVRRTFDSKKAAVLWEEKVLHRLKVTKTTWWLNNNISGGFIRMTPEQIEAKGRKISETKRAKYAAGLYTKRDVTEATREKLRQTRVGVPKSEEHKAKLRGPRPNMDKTNLRKPKSEQTKAKLSAAGKRFWENKRKEVTC